MPKIARLAERLRGAAFPVFVYSAGDLEEPVIHVVLDMVRHLCLTTRAATLTLAAPGNGDGVNLCSAWTCGLPVRTRFVDGLPEHDPWLYASERLIGERRGRRAPLRRCPRGRGRRRRPAACRPCS